MDYDPAHKTSSVTSTGSSTCSIWDPLPSLYTGRADSVSSAYDLDDLQEPAEPFNATNDFHSIVLNEQEKSFNEFLDNFLQENQIKKEVISHDELPTSTNHGNKAKRPYQEMDGNTRNRELLSDDQKRSNHILSEQKRRNTIRGGFKELTEIIPTLKNINNSKSTILFKSVDYIKQLDKRNKVLTERLVQLQQRVQQRTLKRHAHLSVPSNAMTALAAHKHQQKQLALLQAQLRVQHALVTTHQPHKDYHSISIPAMIDTPTTSTTTSPTLPHASLPVHTTSIVSFSSPAALVMPSDEWQPHHASAPSFSIPADENYTNQSHFGFRERLLSSGKLNHLRQTSM